MDINTLAKSIVDQATGDKPIKKPIAKSPAAVARGKARIASMSDGEASRHARNAANKRWHPEENGIKIETGE
jgi:hypothetical protein